MKHHCSSGCRGSSGDLPRGGLNTGEGEACDTDIRGKDEDVNNVKKGLGALNITKCNGELFEMPVSYTLVE